MPSVSHSRDHRGHSHNRASSHGQHAHDHNHGHSHIVGTSLRWALILTLAFSVLEALGGWWAHSLALVGDAGHMLSDAMAMALSALAAWVSKRPPSARHSYGFARAEIVAALFNGVLMLVVIIAIVVEAIQRLLQPQTTAGGAVMGIAFLGLVVNVMVFITLSRDVANKNINLRAALIHVAGDLLGSVAALIAGAVIYYTHWLPIDPILSLFICALILLSTIGLLREALHVLMEAVPLNLDLNLVGQSMAAIPNVVSVHDLHIWTLSSGRLALSAHVVLVSLEDWLRLLIATQKMLHERFDIDHVTLQPEMDQRVLSGPYSAVIPIHDMGKHTQG